LGVSGTLPCRADTQCRPRFGDIWRCRRHVADMSATCGAKGPGMFHTKFTQFHTLFLRPAFPNIRIRQTIPIPYPFAYIISANASKVLGNSSKNVV